VRCREARERLDDFVDGQLSPDDVTDLKRHLRECEGCREEERELRGLLTRASSLMADAAPSRDLWPEIRERVERESVSAFFSAQSWSTWRVAGAMAATILIVAVTATVFYRMGQGSTTDPVGPVIETTPVAHQEPSSQLVQEEFDEARQELRGWLAQNRESLQPETLQRVEDNLRIIDDSVTEIQAALDQNPASQELNRMLMAAYRREVELLRRVNAWYTGM
jgi:anti-sigma-K factor RskA